MSTAVAAPPATGRFVWRDLMTTDPEKVKAFYSELLGWTFTQHDMGDFVYEMFKIGEEHFGGIMPLDPAHGIPSNWVSYIHVPSVDEAVATVSAQGGSVSTPAMDIPEVGRFAIVADPRGAHFALFTSLPIENASGDSSEFVMPPIGGVSWNELLTSDTAGAKDFYGAITGWRFDDMDNTMAGDQTYTVMKQGDRMDGGLMGKPDDLPVSMWVIYYRVEDIDRSRNDVTRLGGQNTTEIIDVPGIGRIAWATDPTGALFAIHQFAA
jgi:predicted enzyme related to lactoylglutathione lyase